MELYQYTSDEELLESQQVRIQPLPFPVLLRVPDYPARPKSQQSDPLMDSRWTRIDREAIDTGRLSSAELETATAKVEIVHAAAPRTEKDQVRLRPQHWLVWMVGLVLIAGGWFLARSPLPSPGFWWPALFQKPKLADGESLDRSSGHEQPGRSAGRKPANIDQPKKSATTSANDPQANIRPSLTRPVGVRLEPMILPLEEEGKSP
ncbi:MAG: hypothetical protein KatS3mg105_0997 [Gemmatales bacterium]|nr:MAG: hypothetical protein KatS3mg105_0997 [Gemmatales bacterium]